MTQSTPAAERPVVEALHDIVDVLSMIIEEFPERSDRAALNLAQQFLLDVAIKHDEAGKYGIYPAFDAADEPAEDAA
jgi:hypothetical protein